MGYRLRSDLSYCEVSDRLVFLDLPADRYFCLSPHLESGFRAIAQGQSDEIANGPTGILLQSGLLIETDGPTRMTACARVEPPRSSALDSLKKRARPLAIGRLAGSIAVARYALRFGRFHRAILELSQRKAALGQCDEVDPNALADFVTQFEWTARLSQAHDRCLPRSLAFARHAIARGWPVDLVMGVQLRPFAAHCWVQRGLCLLNDRVDAVRPFTPILVV